MRRLLLLPAGFCMGVAFAALDLSLIQWLAFYLGLALFFEGTHD